MPVKWRVVPAGLLTIGATWIPCQAQCEVVELHASDPHFRDSFGIDTDICGLFAIVGANKHGHVVGGSGGAYIFRREGVTWIEEAELIVSDPFPDFNAAGAVAIGFGVAAFGSEFDNDGGSNAGAVYIFNRQGTSWSEEIKLTASDASSDQFFGKAVAIDGNRLVVGAWSDDEADEDAGAVYVFERLGDEWIELAKVTASDAAMQDLFGGAVGSDGDLLVAGARRNDDLGISSGSAYVFRYQDGTWEQEAKLLPSNGEGGALFGYDVAVSGERILVGAPYQGFNEPGAAYIFHHTDGVWVEEAILIPNDAASNDNYGKSVSLDGDTALIGAWRASSGLGPGAAYVFHRLDGVWTEAARLDASEGEVGEQFGVSVALDGDWGIIGADDDDDLANNAGSAYVFAGLLGADCNTNDNADVCDIFDGSSDDANDNAIPDECEVECFEMVSESIVCHDDGSTFTYTVEGTDFCTGDLSTYSFTGSGGAVGEELCFTLLIGGSAYCCSTELCVTVPDCSPPDEVGCPADLDGDNLVGIGDFLTVVGSWGGPGGDTNGDGTTDILDFLNVLGLWGPCP